mmetsp:Transcript_18951/g.26747  ORF Transcript_18951/g.26747 Transcript_18951/m.26747 type:complete len:460 (-) Transcript_18951:1019-2398(-)
MKEAREIDEENENELWQEAIRSEMKNNRMAFETCKGDTNDLIGCLELTGHSVFDVKLSENFRRKARFCADGHKVDTPPFLTCSTVVSRDSVRVIFLIAALNDINIQGADVQNAFLSAPAMEKHWMKAGEEFGAEQGKTFIVVRALYGLKSASAAFMAFMAKRLDELGHKSSMADPDVWMRPGKKSDGTEHHEHILCCVDDLLSCSENATEALQSVEGGTMKLKNDKAEPPSVCLGAKTQLKNINGHKCWTISSVDHINAAVKTIKEALKNKPCKLPTKVTNPMTLNCQPELDESPELDAQGVQFYQEMMGMLRWATELGKVDVLLELSMLLQHQASPRMGHLEQALHVFTFLDKHPKLTLCMDPEVPKIDCADFKAKPEEFMEHCRDAEEQLPHRMPRPRGQADVTTAFCDASFAANKKTRRSHTGCIMFVNRAPIIWKSRRQNTLETSALYLSVKHHS